MTQYYEPEARRLEDKASDSNDPVEQSRLWAEAARIGTPVEYCPDGFCELTETGEGCGCEDPSRDRR